jgi:hypothetical protein
MPGAPNRPPEAANAPAPPSSDPAERRVLRRLAPSRVALSLDQWKGAPNAELLAPLEGAEAAYSAGDWREAESRLDALAIRFAEPRWPTLPEPFRRLRVSIPAPQPPQWDPEFSLSPEEKEARRAARGLETQLALAQASVEWAAKKGIDVAELSVALARATEKHGASAPPTDVYVDLDAVWEGLRSRVPLPKGPAGRAPPPREPTAEEA